MKQRMNTSAALGLIANRMNQTDFASETTAVRKRNDVSLEKFALLGGCSGVPGEIDRVRLIGELSRLLHEPGVPEATRSAGLTLIGWLARRMPGEEAHALGVPSSRKKRR